MVVVFGSAHALSLGARMVPLLMAAGMIGVGVGLLKWQRWAWPLALCLLVLDATLVGGILRLLIDVGLLFLLVRPQVRSRFGMR